MDLTMQWYAVSRDCSKLHSLETSFDTYTAASASEMARIQYSDVRYLKRAASVRMESAAACPRCFEMNSRRFLRTPKLSSGTAKTFKSHPTRLACTSVKGSSYSWAVLAVPNRGRCRVG